MTPKQIQSKTKEIEEKITAIQLNANAKIKVLRRQLVDIRKECNHKSKFSDNTCKDCGK